MSTNAALPPVEKLLWGIMEVAAALGIARRTLERMISAGQFPKADLHIGRMPKWRRETVAGWIERGGTG